MEKALAITEMVLAVFGFGFLFSLVVAVVLDRAGKQVASADYEEETRLSRERRKSV